MHIPNPAHIYPPICRTTFSRGPICLGPRMCTGGQWRDWIRLAHLQNCIACNSYLHSSALYCTLLHPVRSCEPKVAQCTLLFAVHNVYIVQLDAQSHIQHSSY